MITIQGFAKLCGCNTQTLRYYDRIGLLAPARVDEWTGYRYYDKEQVRVNLSNGGSVIGMVYIMDQKMDFGQPTPGYYETVKEGYDDCGLDQSVLEQALQSSLELAQARMSDEPQQSW